jgi:NADH:ubiquinone oxidoreductase subunit E
MATWNLDTTKHHVLICNGSSCNRFGAEEVTQAIRSEIANQELDPYIHTTRTRCNVDATINASSFPIQTVFGIKM